MSTMSTSLYEIPVRKITGSDASLAEFKGKVLLVVNVASQCGFTPQYSGLEDLYRKYRDRGLVVAGFPANDFGGQEPGSNDEISSFSSEKYGIDFPMYDKISVVGNSKHPLYAALIEARPKRTSHAGNSLGDSLRGHGFEPNPEPEVIWNFEKFLVSRKGEVVQRFSPDTPPNAPDLVEAIEAELNKA